MKKNLLLLLLTLLSHFFSNAQNYSLDYGQILDSELRMDRYDRDTSAAAVFIYENVLMYHELGKSLRLVKEYSAKIKILTGDGTSWADIEIPFYQRSGARETVFGIEAAAYNLENGQQVKTELQNQMIFREQADDNIWHMKFSIPDVRAGTVIEYKYKLNSDFIANIPELEIQHKIPVIYSHSKVLVPLWFGYKTHQWGFNDLDVSVERKRENQLGITYNADHITVRAEHIPALQGERFVWCIDDLKSRFEFEISEYHFPRSNPVHLSNTWESVYQTLEKTDFRYYIKLSCPFSEEVKKINASTEDKLERARAVLRYVQSNVKWNEKYQIVGESPRAALKVGSGSSAAINFLIMSGLRECGIKPVPVLLNPRSRGRMPIQQPTLEKIRAFVIMIELPEGTYFIDGTHPYSDIGVLPVDLLVERARIFGFAEQWAWVDLSTPQNNSRKHMITGKLDAGGKLNLLHKINTNSTLSIKTNEKFFAAESEDKYVEELEKSGNIIIDDYKITGAGTSMIVEELKYNEGAEVFGKEILLKAALLDFMENNILSEQERKLPIEFDYGYTEEIIARIELPADYTVENLPENITLSACEGGLAFIYISQAQGNVLNVRMSLKINRAIYATDEYEEMRTFFGLVSDKSNERIVLTEI